MFSSASDVRSLRMNAAVNVIPIAASDPSVKGDCYSTIKISSANGYTPNFSSLMVIHRITETMGYNRWRMAPITRARTFQQTTRKSSGFLILMA
jgi:hypothetical protein